jgi:glucan biosynthesis protein
MFRIWLRKALVRSWRGVSEKAFGGAHLDDMPFAQPMNTFDEYVVFQDASDFRARGAGYEYGLSLAA